MTDREAIEQMRKIYTRIMRVAEAYQITVNIEPHGYYTTKPDFLAEMLAFVDSPYLCLNLDVGNIFIAGQDPVRFAERFHSRISHVHVKDISEKTAAEAHGEMTGIASSHCAIGEGVIAGNVRKCVELLVGYCYRGVLTIECKAQNGMVENSVAWLRKLVAEVTSVKTW